MKLTLLNGQHGLQWLSLTSPRVIRALKEPTRGQREAGKLGEGWKSSYQRDDQHRPTQEAQGGGQRPLWSVEKSLEAACSMG